ncbi:MAG: hypothetical protein ACLFR0_05905 [Alphaproteobacteria bacterium]
MNKKASAKNFLDGIYRTDTSDPVLLCQKFYRAAQPPENSLKNKTIHVPYEVFDLCWDVYDDAQKLVQAIDEVLDDSEHALIMEEARNLGYNLPNFDLFLEELEIYRNYLDSLDVFKGEIDRKGYVKIPLKTAQDMHEMMKYNSFMIARVFDDVFNTQYMDHFGFYKRAGFPYSGPNALQPCVRLMNSMTRTMLEIDRQVLLGRQREDWPLMIADHRFVAQDPHIN